MSDNWKIGDTIYKAAVVKVIGPVTVDTVDKVKQVVHPVEISR